MSSFATFSKPVPVGEKTFSVTGLALNFDPVSVVANVRQPSSDADLVSAFVIGAPTRDGFSVELSAAVESAGYFIDFTAFSDGSTSPVDSDTLAMDYQSLVKEVSHYLGYDPSSLSTSEADRVDCCIQSGIRRFYYPPKMDGVSENFEWSFLRQAGSVVTESGVASYRLPDGFGRIAGHLVVSADIGPTIPVIPYGGLRDMAERSPDTGRPRFAAVSCENAYGERGQLKRIHFYPAPDAAYTILFDCDSDTGKLNSTDHPFPLGGAMFAELVRESCLAVAEQSVNDEKGLHTQNFQELLVSMIARDRKSTAQDYGDIGDPEARQSSTRIIPTRGFLI